MQESSNKKTKIPKRLQKWLEGSKIRGKKSLSKMGLFLKNRDLNKWSDHPEWFQWGFTVLCLFLAAGLVAQIVGLWFKPLNKALPPKNMASQRQLPTDDFDSIQKRNMFNVEGKIPDPFDQGLLDCMSQAKPTTQRFLILGTIVMSDEKFSVALLQEEGGQKFGVKKDEVFSDGKFQAMKIDRKRLCFQVKSTQDFEFIEIPDDSGNLGGGPTLQMSSSWVTPISETEFSVPRAALNEKISNLNDILQTARAVPYMEGNRFRGFLIQTIDDNSPFKELGVRTGDILTNVNDIPLDNPGRGLEAYQKLRDSSRVNLEVIRNGRKVNLNFNIN